MGDTPPRLMREEIERKLADYAKWIANGGRPLQNEDERIRYCALGMALAYLDLTEEHEKLRAERDTLLLYQRDWREAAERISTATTALAALRERIETEIARYERRLSGLTRKVIRDFAPAAAENDALSMLRSLLVEPAPPKGETE